MAKREKRKRANACPQREQPLVAVQTEFMVAMESLRKIDEISSHKAIYEPLLQRMGYQNVTYCHGQFERGKDFVCIDKNRLGHADLTVIQIKNSKITADSTSSDSAIGIINQIDRCLNTKIMNPLTHREELPRRVVLFTSHPFPDHGVAGMSDRLEQLRRVCEIVEGTTILELLKEYLTEIYVELLHPGQGLGEAVLRQLKVTTELSAIGVNRDRELPSFFTNIGVSSARGLLHSIASGLLKVAPAGTRLRYSKPVFRVIESLSSSVTKLLKTEELFKLIESVPAVRRDREDSLDPRRISSRPLGSGQTKKRSLSDEVIVELGDFDTVLAALQDLRRDVEIKQASDSDLFAKYNYCLNNIEKMLRQMDVKQPSNDLGRVLLKVPIKEQRPKYSLRISELDPALLVPSNASFAIEGEAGRQD